MSNTWKEPTIKRWWLGVFSLKIGHQMLSQKFIIKPFPPKIHHQTLPKKSSSNPSEKLSIKRCPKNSSSNPSQKFFIKPYPRNSSSKAVPAPCSPWDASPGPGGCGGTGTFADDKGDDDFSPPLGQQELRARWEVLSDVLSPPCLPGVSVYFPKFLGEPSTEVGTLVST